MADQSTKDATNPQQKQEKPLPGEYYDSKHGVLWNIWTTKEILEHCERFQFREDDVVLATFPKSGTTLVQEALWLIFNNMDVEGAKQEPIYTRVPFLELHMFIADEFGNAGQQIHMLEEAPTNKPRLMKTHLPLRYIRPNLEAVSPKVIYVVRNPKDTMVSYYHFYKGVDDYGPWEGSFHDYFQLWMSGHIVSGDWFDVVPEWFSLRDQPNCLFIHYEDLLSHPREQFQRVAEFCGRPLTAEQLEMLVKHTRFDAMRANPSTNYSTMPGVNYSFMRKGQAGDWKNYFTVAENEYFDAVFEAKCGGKLPEFRFS